jgi:hypothetical protein
MIELLPPRWRQNWEYGTPYDMMMRNVGSINTSAIYKWACTESIFYEEPTARPEDRWIPTGMECSVAEAIAAAGGPLKDHPSWSLPHTITGLHVIIDRSPWDDSRRRDRALEFGATTAPQQPAFDVDADSLLPMRRPQPVCPAEPTPSASCQWSAPAAPRRLRLQPPRPALTAAWWATPAAAISHEQASIFSLPAFNSALPTVTSAAAGACVAQRVMLTGRSAAVAAAGMGDHAPCLLAYHAAAAAPPAPCDQVKPADTAGRKKRWWDRRAAACAASGVLLGGLHLLCSAGSAAAGLLALTT